ncbi:hypothetical protein KM043_004540 [Ampulex compressa]|nr:hypothetical protein KM043_004540 [Ampulex compressa]
MEQSKFHWGFTEVRAQEGRNAALAFSELLQRVVLLARTAFYVCKCWYTRRYLFICLVAASCREEEETEKKRSRPGMPESLPSVVRRPYFPPDLIRSFMREDVGC